MSDARVQERWAEFLGVDGLGVDGLGANGLDSASCVYVKAPMPTVSDPFSPRRPHELSRLIRRDGEAARSLWDHRDLIVDLDVEHVHFDEPRTPLLDRERSWKIQEPVVETIQGLFRRLELQPLHFLTGRGHHWMWRIARDGRVFRDLELLGTLTPGLQARYSAPVEGIGETVGLGLGAAFDGLGKLMEYLGHQVLARADMAPSPVPVRLTAVAVPPGPSGREAVSIDLSLYGDPLDRRAVRLPYTPYRKFWQPGDAPIIALPVPPGREREAHEATSDLAAALEWARFASAKIPRDEKGTAALLRRYLSSDLAQVHRRYYAARPDPVASWPATYDRLDLDTLPPCVARILASPNDLALKPAAIELLTRTLLALGWVPRHIGGLLRSKLERDHQWIPEIHFHEPSCRAEFYVRLFTGLALASPGRHGELDCFQIQAERLCPLAGPGDCCPWNLRELPQPPQLGERKGERR